MTTGISTATAANTLTQSSSSRTSAADATKVTQDMFLQLFAKQLQYQDPTSPLDTDQFLGQLAQLTTVEGITSMSSGIESLGSKFDLMLESMTNNNDLSALTALNAGTGLLGKTVQFGDGPQDYGEVNAIQQTDGQVMAVVDGQLVPISQLQTIVASQ